MRAAGCKGDCCVMQKAQIPEEGMCCPCCSDGACLALGSNDWGITDWQDLLTGKKPSGASYEQAPKDKCL